MDIIRKKENEKIELFNNFQIKKIKNVNQVIEEINSQISVIIIRLFKKGIGFLQAGRIKAFFKTFRNFY